MGIKDFFKNRKRENQSDCCSVSIVSADDGDNQENTNTGTLQRRETIRNQEAEQDN